MADSVEHFVSVDAQWAKAKQNFTGGMFNQTPIEHPPMTFVDGHDRLVTEKLEMTPTPKVSPTDPWVDRKSNSAY